RSGLTALARIFLLSRLFLGFVNLPIAFHTREVAGSSPAAPTSPVPMRSWPHDRAFPERSSMTTHDCVALASEVRPAVPDLSTSLSPFTRLMAGRYHQRAGVE